MTAPTPPEPPITDFWAWFIDFLLTLADDLDAADQDTDDSQGKAAA